MASTMKLLEIVEDGRKAQIVLEDITYEDVRALHAYQLAQGEGVLVIGDRIRYYTEGLDEEA